jgi:hypothetical protein
LIASGLSTSAFNRAKRPSVLRSCQLVEQRLGVLQIGGLEALGEPAVDRREGARRQVGKILERLSSSWAMRVQIATTLLILGMGMVFPLKAANQLASLPG